MNRNSCIYCVCSSTASMNKLEDVDSTALRETLTGASSAKATKRLMIAIAYTRMESVLTLSASYSVFRGRRSTRARSVRTGADRQGDRRRVTSGRPSKLNDSQRGSCSLIHRNRRPSSGMNRQSGRLNSSKPTLSKSTEPVTQ